MLGCCPTLPKPKSLLFTKNNFFTLKKVACEAGPPWQSQEVRSPKEVLEVRHPAAGTWATLTRVTFELVYLHPPSLLAATPYPAVFVLARTLGTINPVRRDWIYGH